MAVVIDNAELVWRLGTVPTCCNISDHLCFKYNSWKLLWELKGGLPFDLDVSWVGSHQDINSEGQRIYRYFHLEVMVNMEEAD